MASRGSSVPPGVWWALSLVWAVKIFLLSTESFNSDASRSILAQLLGWLRLSLPPLVFYVLHSIARKGAHLLEYGVFAVLLYRSFLGPSTTHWNRRLASLAFLAASVYAATDEFHQLFVRLRGASVQDWMIDSLGAGIGLLLLYTYVRSAATGWFGAAQNPALTRGASETIT